LLHVYAIGTGATLSGGLFLLPGLAAADAGPALIVCYLLAIVPLVPAMLCSAELATAMPRAGGYYYFLDRSLGPLAGTVGGLGMWLVLMLKSAFALVGMGAYMHLFVHDAPETAVAVVLALGFGVVNVLGASSTGRFQLVLVTGVLAILAAFIGKGTVAIEADRFAGFFDQGSHAIVATTGLVYVSYVGLAKIPSLSEEVRNPQRNLPLGIFLSMVTVVAVYMACLLVMVGVIPMADLAGSHTPMAEAARRTAGRAGEILITIAALLAFSSVANAGILSASRYPLAMSRDHLLPGRLRTLDRRNTPITAVVVTVAVMVAILVLLDPLKIAKLASAFQLVIFALVCLAVVVMRESRIEAYDPGYRSPGYPWLHVVGIIVPFIVIAQMGWLPILFSSGLMVLGVGWYMYYARRRVGRQGAIYHVFERLARRRYDDLDRELRSILKEKGLREEDPFEEVIAHAAVIDVSGSESFEEVVGRASAALAPRVGSPAEKLGRGFLEGTRTGATPVAGGAALPHLRLRELPSPHLAVVRCRSGVALRAGEAREGASVPDTTFAIFFLVSPEANPGQHLRLLAQLASRVDEPEFVSRWLEAEDEDGLREILLRDERYLSVRVQAEDGTRLLMGRPLRDLGLPEGCLVAVVRRAGEAIVPRGDTILEEGDRVTIIGSVRALEEVHRRLGL
jgi:amino acid transporter/mannitol/fructose-specific phosphotransferase system IIA component (Ntr-type)